MGADQGTTVGVTPIDIPAHSLPFEAVLKELTTEPDVGLSDAEVLERRKLYGENALNEGSKVSPLTILIHQVANALTLVSECRGHHFNATRS